jgi:hypothetical protein
MLVYQLVSILSSLLTCASAGMVLTHCLLTAVHSILPEEQRSHSGAVQQ